MLDYEELVKELREADEKSMCGECGMNLNSGTTKKGVLFAEAADAIEELTISVKQYKQIVDRQNEMLSKKITKEIWRRELSKPQWLGHFFAEQSGTSHWMPLIEPPKEEHNEKK